MNATPAGTPGRSTRHRVDHGVAALSVAGIVVCVYLYFHWLPAAREDETGLAYLGPWLAISCAVFFVAALGCTLAGLRTGRSTLLVAGRVLCACSVAGWPPLLLMIAVLSVLPA